MLKRDAQQQQLKTKSFAETIHKELFANFSNWNKRTNKKKLGEQSTATENKC